MIVETEESFAMSQVNTVFWALIGVSSVILVIVGIIVVIMIHRNISKPLKTAIQGLSAASEQVLRICPGLFLEPVYGPGLK